MAPKRNASAKAKCKAKAKGTKKEELEKEKESRHTNRRDNQEKVVRSIEHKCDDMTPFERSGVKVEIDGEKLSFVQALKSLTTKKHAKKLNVTHAEVVQLKTLFKNKDSASTGNIQADEALAMYII